MGFGYRVIIFPNPLMYLVRLHKYDDLFSFTASNEILVSLSLVYLLDGCILATR